MSALGSAAMAADHDAVDLDDVLAAAAAIERQIVRTGAAGVLVGSEDTIEESVNLLLDKTVVAGAGAAGLAALMANPEQFCGRRVGPVPRGVRQ